MKYTNLIYQNNKTSALFEYEQGFLCCVLEERTKFSENLKIPIAY